MSEIDNGGPAAEGTGAGAGNPTSKMARRRAREMALQGVYQWLESLPNPPQLVRMPDTSHFFHRKLIDLRGAIQHEVRRWLPDGSN